MEGAFVVVMRFVAYLRVSTDKQGKAGLGIEAQRELVKRHLGDALPIQEFVEVESGKRTDRPQLAAALAACRAHGATLIIAKLDRLARNLHFISGLMESGVDFIATDNPHANRLTIHVLSAVAEEEARMISRRTKDALAAAKARGVKLGNPNGAWAFPGKQISNDAALAAVKARQRDVRRTSWRRSSASARVRERRVTALLPRCSMRAVSGRTRWAVVSDERQAGHAAG
jgi:DNA invertase Pin-like site-specific DNA recombinase